MKFVVFLKTEQGNDAVVVSTSGDSFTACEDVGQAKDYKFRMIAELRAAKIAEVHGLTTWVEGFVA